jgi:dTDP-4-amino-4,6-dideoxygalactose transaminase
MAALLLDLGPGDEVIMPSFAFASIANAVVLRGATPVFVDIDRLSLNVDPGCVAAAITPRTRAIFVVHYAGVVAEMTTLRNIAQAHGLALVEDAAQALGATYEGKPAGSFGDIAAFSFHDTKNVIAGEGGALVLNRPELVARAEIIREKGTNRAAFLRDEVDKYTWVDIGSSYVVSELNAAFLFGQLEDWEGIARARGALWRAYDDAFRRSEFAELIGLPHVPPKCTHNAHMYYLIAPSGDARGDFIDFMKGEGIQTPFHFVPLHSSPAGRRFARVAGKMDVTDDIAGRLVRLPLHLRLGEDVDRVIRGVRQWCGRSRERRLA